jgi:hypothetical protein
LTTSYYPVLARFAITIGLQHPKPQSPHFISKKTRQLLRKIKKNKFDASLKKKRNIIAKKNKNKNEV